MTANRSSLSPSPTPTPNGGATAASGLARRAAGSSGRAGVALATLLVLAAVAAIAPPPLAAQGPPGPSPEQVAAMAELAWLEGTWEGSGWIQMGPEHREEFTVRETAELELGGLVVVVRGEGFGATADGGQRKVHDALGVIEFDPAAGEYRMHAWQMQGRSIVAPAEMVDGGFRWSLPETPAGPIRYTLRHTDDSHWHEVGEISRDGGESWFQFFDQKLTRVE